METLCFIDQNLQNYEKCKVLYLAQKRSKLFEMWSLFNFRLVKWCVRISINMNNFQRSYGRKHIMTK